MSFQGDDFERIVILQNSKQLKKYSKKFSQANDLILAIGPESIYFCIKKKLKYITFRDFVDVDLHYSESKEFEKRLSETIKNLNNYSTKLKPEYDLEIGNYFSFQLWLILGQISFSFFLLTSLKKKFPNSHILVFKNKHSSKFFRLRPNPESLIPSTLENSNIYNKKNISVANVSQQISFKQFFEDFFFFAKEIRDILKLLPHQLFSSSKTKLAIIGGGYDWFKILKNKKFNRKFLISYLNLKPPKNKKGGFDSKVLEILNDSFFKSGNIHFDLSELSDDINNYLEHFFKRRNFLNELIKKQEVLLSGVLTWPEENFLAHLGIQNNKRVILWQHGERGQSYDPSIEFTEMLYATDFLTYGKSVTKIYKKWLNKYYLKNVQTLGSLSKQSFWKKNESKKILYATGKWHKNAVPYLNVIDPDKRLIDAHLSLLTFLNDIEGWETTFKLNNTKELNNIPYKDNFKKIKFESKISFTRLLENSELVILDTPSTTLIEACSTSIPIFALSGRNVYSREFLKKVSSRVVWCESTEELISRLNYYLNNRHYDADLLDNSFVNSYFYLNSESSIVEEVTNLIENKI